MQDRTIVDVPSSTWALIEKLSQERGRSTDETLRAAAGALIVVKTLLEQNPEAMDRAVEETAEQMRAEIQAVRGKLRPERN